MKSYNIVVDAAVANWYQPQDTPIPKTTCDGWIGGLGPGIDYGLWPRDTRTGLPMIHCITLRLPADYQRRGPEYPGIALFQSLSDECVTTDSPIEPIKQHPQLCLREDCIGGEFALIWLTDEELERQPVEIPNDPRLEIVLPNNYDKGAVWKIWLVERDDPNTGKAPIDFLSIQKGDEYQSFWDEENHTYYPWAEALSNYHNHLGGTAFPAQGLPDGFTPYYLELDELPGMNIGGDGVIQIDLESDAFDWQCG